MRPWLGGPCGLGPLWMVGGGRTLFRWRQVGAALGFWVVECLPPVSQRVLGDCLPRVSQRVLGLGAAGEKLPAGPPGAVCQGLKWGPCQGLCCGQVH